MVPSVVKLRPINNFAKVDLPEPLVPTIAVTLFLGIVQGVAEFLPISSSGHLSIAQNLLFSADAVANDNLSFDVYEIMTDLIENCM